MRFEEKLVTLRKERKLSQEQLAEKLGVSRQAVSRWESGETTPDMANIISLCDIFEVSADYLIRAGEAVQVVSNSAQDQVAPATRNHYHIFSLVSALCFQVGVVASVIGICYSDYVWQSLLIGICAGVCSGLASYQFIRYGRGL